MARRIAAVVGSAWVERDADGKLSIVIRPGQRVAELSDAELNDVTDALLSFQRMDDAERRERE